MKKFLLWLAIIALIGSSTSVTASAAVKAGDHDEVKIEKVG
jgi:hypothetical protein